MSLEIIEENLPPVSLPPLPVIAVAVGRSKNFGSNGRFASKTSLNALKWALDHLVNRGGSVSLIHIYPPLRFIPTPMGNNLPLNQVNDEIVERFKEQQMADVQMLMLQCQGMCERKKVKVNDFLVESDTVQKSLVCQINEIGISKLVLGISSRNKLSRSFHGPPKSEFVAKHAPEFCSVLVIRNGKIISTRHSISGLDIPLPEISNTDLSVLTSTNQGVQTVRRTVSLDFVAVTSNNSPMPIYNRRQHSSPLPEQVEYQSPTEQTSTLQMELKFRKKGVQRRMISVSSCDFLHARMCSFDTLPFDQGANGNNGDVDSISNSSSDTGNIESGSCKDLRQILECASEHSLEEKDINKPTTSENMMESEIEKIGRLIITARRKMELQEEQLRKTEENFLDTARKALEYEEQIRGDSIEKGDALRSFQVMQLTIAREKRLHEELIISLEDARRELKVSKQSLSQEKSKAEAAIAALERMKGEARKALRQEAETQAQLDALKKMLETEASLRKEAEEKVQRELLAKQEAMATLRQLQQKYTVYTYEALQEATNNFSESLKIGQGGYGIVYRGMIDYTFAAIKVLTQEGRQGRQEFQSEVELLSHIHHPHLVMLLGACPEKACIVYEYMANGSLEDRLSCKNGTRPLPWYIRFRICYEVSLALMFLHGSHPDPIIHRDVKPGNILLDRNLVSKLGDVGLARLVPRNTTFSVTYYRETLLAGTFPYMDPDYARTGTFGPHSDVYGLGMVILQILTAKSPVGITESIENALESGRLSEVLDRSAGDWPLHEAEALASIATRCAEPKRRDRISLPEVLHVLKEIQQVAEVAEAYANWKCDEELVIPSVYLCPISQEIMEDPHIAPDGFTYECENIKAWLSDHETSPMTNLILHHKNLIPNHSLRSAIREWQARGQHTSSC